MIVHDKPCFIIIKYKFSRMLFLIIFETFTPLQDKGLLKLRLEFIIFLDSKAEFQANLLEFINVFLRYNCRSASIFRNLNI